MGLFGGIGKVIGKGIKLAKGTIGKALPGGALATGAVGIIGSKIFKRANRDALKKAIPAVAAGGAGIAVGEMLGGGGGGGGRRYRRINPGNTRAMRRAVRRIEQGAKLYSKLFRIKHGGIKGAPNVRVRRAK